MVSALGFGGSEIGHESVTAETVDTLLNAALDAGLNLIDTAECYRESEDKIGRAIASRRDEFVLMTKCGHNQGFDEPDWDPAMLAKSIDRSLQRLQTDHVEVVQLHSCSREMLEQGDVIEPLIRAKESGKTRYIGYSGDSHAALWAVESGIFDTLQTSINIADQECVDLTLPKAVERDMGIIAKRPIANVAWTFNSENVGGYERTYFERLRILNYPFLPGDNAVATALRFTLACPGVATAIVGTTKPGRWSQNSALIEHPINEEVFEAIRERWMQASERSWTGQT